MLGKVHGGGKAITGDDGARVAQVEIVTLVTADPEPLAPLLDHYGIEAIPPTPKTRAWIVDAADNTVTIATPDEVQDTGLFIVDEGDRRTRGGVPRRRRVRAARRDATHHPHRPRVQQRGLTCVGPASNLAALEPRPRLAARSTPNAPPLPAPRSDTPRCQPSSDWPCSLAVTGAWHADRPRTWRSTTSSRSPKVART